MRVNYEPVRRHLSSGPFKVCGGRSCNSRCLRRAGKKAGMEGRSINENTDLYIFFLPIVYSTSSRVSFHSVRIRTSLSINLFVETSAQPSLHKTPELSVVPELVSAMYLHQPSPAFGLLSRGNMTRERVASR